MKTWKIPVVWQCWSMCDIEANTLAEAIERVKSANEPLPTKWDYVDDSLEIDLDGNIEAIREAWNWDQEDENG